MSDEHDIHGDPCGGNAAPYALGALTEDEHIAFRRHLESCAVCREEAREVRDALDRLPDEQSKVIELAYFGGLTHVQIASMLDTPVGTVKGRMRLGLSKMRMTLGNPAEVLP